MEMKERDKLVSLKFISPENLFQGEWDFHLFFFKKYRILCRNVDKCYGVYVKLF